MTESAKNLADVMIAIIGMTGAAFAFLHTLREWQEAQRWKRAEQLDKLIDLFEKEDLLRLARAAIDWETRIISYGGRELKLTNDDILLALRRHQDLDADADYKFPGEQPIIRDSLDSMIIFLTRLELAITAKLIDVAPAKLYFRYWVFHLLAMDKHSDKGNVLAGRSPESMAREYIQEYGDEESMARLCRLFEIDWPANQRLQRTAEAAR